MPDYKKLGLAAAASLALTTGCDDKSTELIDHHKVENTTQDFNSGVKTICSTNYDTNLDKRLHQDEVNNNILAELMLNEKNTKNQVGEYRELLEKSTSLHPAEAAIRILQYKGPFKDDSYNLVEQILSNGIDVSNLDNKQIINYTKSLFGKELTQDQASKAVMIIIQDNKGMVLDENNQDLLSNTIIENLNQANAQELIQENLAEFSSEKVNTYLKQENTNCDTLEKYKNILDELADELTQELTDNNNVELVDGQLYVYLSELDNLRLPAFIYDTHFSTNYYSDFGDSFNDNLKEVIYHRHSEYTTNIEEVLTPEKKVNTTKIIKGEIKENLNNFIVEQTEKYQTHIQKMSELYGLSKTETLAALNNNDILLDKISKENKFDYIDGENDTIYNGDTYYSQVPIDFTEDGEYNFESMENKGLNEDDIKKEALLLDINFEDRSHYDLTLGAIDTVKNNSVELTPLQIQNKLDNIVTNSKYLDTLTVYGEPNIKLFKLFTKYGALDQNTFIDKLEQHPEGAGIIKNIETNRILQKYAEKYKDDPVISIYIRNGELRIFNKLGAGYSTYFSIPKFNNGIPHHEENLEYVNSEEKFDELVEKTRQKSN